MDQRVRSAMPTGVYVVVLISLMSWCSSTTHGQRLLPRDQHDWGRFEVGSWSRVRVLSETLDEEGCAVTSSVTETKTTLVDASRDFYTLMIESSLTAGGKHFPGKVQVVRRSYRIGQAGSHVLVQDLGNTGLTVGGRNVDSDIRRLVIDEAGAKKTITVHYAESTSPYILQSTTTVSDTSGRQAKSETTMRTVELDVPVEVLDTTRHVSLLETVRKTPIATILTNATHCVDVPGGVIDSTSEERDTQGRLIRREHLSLLDFSAICNPSIKAKPVRRRTRRR